MRRIMILFLAFVCLHSCGENPTRKDLAAAKASQDAEEVAHFRYEEREIAITVLLALIPVVVAFTFVVFVFYRARRESFFKQKEAELKFDITELELKALRAQINPHFIFNCLNSIHHYMNQHAVQEAGDYLVKFSRLIRYVLESSSLKWVPLKEDIDVLRIYMELEQLRLQGAFDFQIRTAEGEDYNVNIPPMMMQPFVENSIWHGFSKKNGGGVITIDLKKNASMLECTIEDNGFRSEANAEEVLSGIKKTSMGMTLIKDRLGVVSRVCNVEAGFKATNRMDDPVPTTGTRIVLTLPFDN